jgi:hypothetical protein
MKREPYHERLYRELHSDAQEVAGDDFRVPLFVGEAHSFPERRNMAYCMYKDGNDGARDITIVIAPKLAKGDGARLQAVLRHELAHALEFHLGEKELHNLARADGFHLPAGAERRADRVAEIIWEDPIYYDQDLVQTLSGGSRPRPSHLGY